MVAFTRRQRSIWAYGLLSIAALAILAALLGSARAEGPPLEVISPEDGLLTNDRDLSVIGTTVPYARVDLYMVLGSGGHIEYSAMSDGKGLFVVPLRLYEGRQTIRVTATDAKDFTNETSRTIWLDTVPPRLSVHPPSGSTVHTRMHRYTIIFTASNDAEVHPDIYPYVVTQKDGVYQMDVNLTEGENIIIIRAADRAGNVAKAVVTIVADFTPPTLGVRSPAPRTVLTNKSLIQFAGNSTGADRVVVGYAHLQYDATLLAGGDGGFWGCNVPLVLGDGTWTFTVRALDTAGNEASWSCTVCRDTASPRFEIWPPIPDECDTSVLMVSGKFDEEVGMVLINGQSFPVSDSGFRVPWRLAEGRNVISVETWDATGNHASFGYAVLYSDGPPGLRLLVPRSSDEPRVHVRGRTDVNAVKVLVDGVPIKVVNGSFDAVVELWKGRNRIRVEVVDPAGNVRSEEVVVSYGTAWPEVAAIAAVVAAVLMWAWLVLGWRERRARRHAARGRAPG